VGKYGSFTEIEFSESSFKHGIQEADIRNAMEIFVFDEEIDGYNVFHAMKCRTEFLKLIER
jgi:hypothetical protein